MRSVREIFRETLGKYIPYFIQVIVVIAACWYAHTYIVTYCSPRPTDTEWQIFVCYLVIVCAGVLWARMTYLHNKVMEKLREMEGKNGTK